MDQNTWMWLTLQVWTKLYGYRPNFIGMDQTTVYWYDQNYTCIDQTIWVWLKLYR